MQDHRFESDRKAGGYRHFTEGCVDGDPAKYPTPREYVRRLLAEPPGAMSMLVTDMEAMAFFREDASPLTIAQYMRLVQRPTVTSTFVTTGKRAKIAMLFWTFPTMAKFFWIALNPAEPGERLLLQLLTVHDHWSMTVVFDETRNVTFQAPNRMKGGAASLIEQTHDGTPWTDKMYREELEAVLVRNDGPDGMISRILAKYGANAPTK